MYNTFAIVRCCSTVWSMTEICVYWWRWCANERLCYVIREVMLIIILGGAQTRRYTHLHNNPCYVCKSRVSYVMQSQQNIPVFNKANAISAIARCLEISAYVTQVWWSWRCSSINTRADLTTRILQSARYHGEYCRYKSWSRCPECDDGIQNVTVWP